MKSVTAMLVVSCALTLSTTMSLAQESSRKLRWNTEDQADTRTSRKSFVRMTASVNGEKYDVEVEGDQVRAMVNDEPVPSERVRKTPDAVEILDEHGDVLHRFEMFGGPQRMGQPGGVFGETARPKVMIGITMDDTPEGVRIDSVIEGLPAALAGLKAGDVIRELNDKPVEQAADFRAAIGALEADDVARIVVFRNGKDVELKVKVERFDEARLGAATGNRVFTRRIESPNQRAHDEFMSELRDALKGLNLSEEQHKAIEDRMGSTFTRLTESMNLGLMGLPEGMQFMPQGRVWTVDPSTPDRGMTFKLPQADEASDRKFDQLMKRLDAMERRIEGLSRQLDEKH